MGDTARVNNGTIVEVMSGLFTTKDEFVSRLSLNRLCIVTAVDIEFKVAAGLLTECSFSEESGFKLCRGYSGPRRITVLKSEIGGPGFELSTHLKNNRYDALIVAGLAGGLDPKLKAGDAVIYDLCYDGRAKQAESNSQEKSSACRENTSIASDDELSRFLLKTLQISGSPCVCGAGVTVGQVVTEAKSKILLGSKFNAAVVDMETYDVMHICSKIELPVSALRVVSDDALANLPDFNRALNGDGQISGWLLASAMLMRPLDSLRFLLNIRPVIGALRANLRAIFDA